MKKFDYNVWFTLAQQYLQTSRLVMEQIRINKNKWLMIDNKPIEWDAYFEATKWSDFNTFVPSLFLMHHGIELLIKGLVLWTGSIPEYEHETKDFLSHLQTNEKISSDLINLFEEYAGDSPKNRLIREFRALNGHLNKSTVHVGLRYPEYRGKETNFSALRYRENDILSDVDSIILDIEKMMAMTVAIVRSD